MSAGIEHENRIILNRFHQQPESLLAVSQLECVLESLCFLLKFSDRAQAFFRDTRPKIALGGKNARMFRTHLQKRLDAAILIESCDGICAEQRELVVSSQVI